MRRETPFILVCASGLLTLSAAQAQAHSFGEPYQLPLPYAMYIYAAMAALVLSFVVAAFFLRQGKHRLHRLGGVIPTQRALRLAEKIRLGSMLQWLLSGSFILAIVSGLIGSVDPFRNFNMTFFWLVFALGGNYLSALLGNWYDYLNPWHHLARRLPGLDIARLLYPAWLAYWPALLLYFVFVALELFGHNRPFSLSIALLGYTAINLLGCYLFSAKCWFRHGEFFAVMFRLTSTMAPLHIERDGHGTVRLHARLPFSGLLGQSAPHISLLLFLLFMLSSTAFDGFRETALWFNLFWKDPFNLLTPLLGQNPILQYVELRHWYIALEAFTLLISPLLYLGLFLFFLWLGKTLVRSTLGLLDLSNRFAFSLLPIALVYHITHYYSLLLSQGSKIRGLISDPFGWGWNLFGTAISGRIPILPDMGFIWYSQVWLILIGHIASVFIAHTEALRVFPDQRRASLSQLPMLVLMVLFTGVGLWILAQPLQG